MRKKMFGLTAAAVCLAMLAGCGAGGGASELTGEARTLLERYHKFEQSVQKFAAEQFDMYFGELFSCGKLI